MSQLNFSLFKKFHVVVVFVVDKWTVYDDDFCRDSEHDLQHEVCRTCATHFYGLLWR